MCNLTLVNNLKITQCDLKELCKKGLLIASPVCTYVNIIEFLNLPLV